MEEKLAKLIIETLKVEPTKGQEQASKTIASFLYDSDMDGVMLLKGYAGTGKTLLISALVQVLKAFKIKSVLMAPTGRAAKVLSSYSACPAFTIHKVIYRQKNTADGLGRFDLNYNRNKDTIFIVDESSMISDQVQEQSIFGSGRLLDDLIEYTYNGNNCRLMLVGDTAQLPPVGIDVSPALDVGKLEFYNRKVFNHEMLDVVRQVAGSGILFNATLVREHLISQSSFSGLQLTNFPDVKQVNGEDLIEQIGSSYDHCGIEETIIITRSNNRANKYNEGIRRTILWKESELSKGDMLMIVKNNYFWSEKVEELDFIANGDIVRVERVRKIQELYGFRFADVTLSFIDYEDMEIDCKIILDTLTLDTASLSGDKGRELFERVSEDYLYIRSKKKRWEEIRENEYFNALQVKFSYAITCHKSQGGQWNSVFVDHGWLSEEMINREFYRWLYTAITRAKKKLYFVNFKKEFISDYKSSEIS